MRTHIASVLLVVFFPAVALGQGSADYWLEPGHARSTAAVCGLSISPQWQNYLYKGGFSVADSRVRFYTVDRNNNISATYAAPSVATKGAFEISDTGPSGYVNVAFTTPSGAGNYNDVWFSTDSGQTFTKIDLASSGAYPLFDQYSIGGQMARDNSMKFGQDGNLYVFYFASNANADRYVLFLQIIDINGNVVGFEDFSTAVCDIAGTPAVETCGDGEALGIINKHFIEVVSIGTKLVAVFLPGTKWWDCDLNQPNCSNSPADIAEAIVYDYSLPIGSRVVQRIHIGTRSDNGSSPYLGNENYNAWYAGANGPEALTRILTTDGHSVYLISQSEPKGTPQIRNYQIRRFPPCEEASWPEPNDCPPGGFFPDNNNTVNSEPLVELSLLPVQVETEDFMGPVTESGTYGKLFGFAAKRYTANFTNEVDILYQSHAQMVIQLDDKEIQRLRFNPDIALSSSVVPEILNDINPATALESGAGISISIDQGYTSSTFVSAKGATAASFCEITGLPGVPRLHVTDIS